MKKIFAVALSLAIVVGAVGCSSSENEKAISDLPNAEDSINNDNKGIAVNYIEFERVDLEDLSEEFKELIEENKKEKGYKLLEDSSSEYSYLVVFAGQKPSAGYDIEIKKVVDNEGVTDVMVTQTPPTEGMMAAEVLTYPMDIVKLTGITDNINLIYLEGDSKSSTDPNQSTSMLATTYVEGEYVGLIDNNSIEVKIEDGPQAFQLTDVTKEQISSYKKGDIIGFDYLKNEKGQNVIISFKQEKQFITGDYVGQIDPHSIEVTIEDGPVTFQLNDAAVNQVGSFKEGDLIKIEYVKNESGQMVANELIKVEE